MRRLIVRGHPKCAAGGDTQAMIDAIRMTGGQVEFATDDTLPIDQLATYELLDYDPIREGFVAPQHGLTNEFIVPKKAVT